MRERSLENARALPSGANAWQQSPSYPGGGDVSCRFSPVSTATKKIPSRSVGAGLSTIARNFPSGDQDKPGLEAAANLRSPPPSAGTMKIAPPPSDSL